MTSNDNDNPPVTFPEPPPTGDDKYDRLLLAVHKLVWEKYKEFGREPEKIVIDDEYILRAVKTFVVGRMYKYDINSKRAKDAVEMTRLRKTPEGRKLIEALLKKNREESDE